MSKHDNGGPAFPATEEYTFGGGVGTERHPGMSLRAYFAAKALAGILAYPGDACAGSAHNNSTPPRVAKLAYVYADAMLRARKESQP